MYDPKKITRKDVIKFLGDTLEVPDTCSTEIDNYILCVSKFRSNPDANCGAKVFRERKRSLIFDILRVSTLRYNLRYNKGLKKP